jgi:RNA polymerase sigma factor (sigma-70 family)
MYRVPRFEADSDHALVEACLRGEAAAWEALVRRYANLVYSVARRYGLDDDDAADVFQNSWATLWERLVEVRDRSKLGPWLMTVTGRLAYQAVERRQRFASRHQSGADLAGRADSQALPEELAIAGDQAAAVRAAMARLSPRCRELLESLFYDPSAPSYAEIARRLAVAVDTVGPLRGRCLRKLKILLEEYGFLEER